MASFGLITEGITDQIVIESILYGFFNDKDIPVNPLSPLRDATDENRAATASNWIEVFEYCASSRFKSEVFINDYLIIQIDTDALKGDSVAQKYRIDLPNTLTVEEVVEAVKEKIIELIGADFYKEHQHKIIFAISVHSIECWLLPIYFANQPAKSRKTENCLSTLNQAISQKEGFFIGDKEPKYYRAISKKLQKHRDLKQFSPLNPSLHIFIQELEQRNIEV
jgi:hypothetical protein